MRWNGGVSFPIQSGHGCIGCSEEDFWDNGPFYARLAGVGPLSIDLNADKIGLGAVGAIGAGIAVHAALSAVARAREERKPKKNEEGER